ncbi:hypothetical protein OPQ81_010756 [Rhizoctonia solani]|nr:hypothetical protein OPQ81_010756 [Rhizoctonia solani]
MLVSKLTSEANLSLNMIPVDTASETPLHRALSDRDLTQQTEGTSACPSHSVLSSPNPRKGLRSPRAKGPYKVAQVPKGAHKALVIGLNGPIAHKERSLGYAVQDAKRFEKCLKKLNGLGQQPNSHLSGGFNFEIEVLTDEDGKSVPRTKIFRALDTLFSGAKSEDLLVLFFSGHCSKNQPNGIVSLMTVEDNNNYRLVPSTVFSQYINKLPPGCTVEVFLDCCYSSGLVQLENVIRKMTPDSIAPKSIHWSPFSSEIVTGRHSDTAPSSAPPLVVFSGSQCIDSNSSNDSGTAAGATKIPCVTNRALVGLPGPRPNEKISTQAHVIVWAASDITEKAYESCQYEAGPLAKTICDKIEQSSVMQREILWEQAMSDMDYENGLRRAILPGTDQHARILASFQNSEEIMNTPIFCTPPR